MCYQTRMLYLSDRIISGSFADSLLKWLPATLKASISSRLEEIVVRSLEQTETWRRWRLFDEISERSNLSLFCVGSSSEHYVINCRDKHISRELFLGGEQRDFQKLLASIDIIAQKGRRPTVLVDVGAESGIDLHSSCCARPLRQSYRDRTTPTKLQIVTGKRRIEWCSRSDRDF